MQVLFELCRFRNHHPAFNGKFELLDTIPDIKESTLSPAPPAPLPGALTPAASLDNVAESGSFAAQTVSLLASLDGEEQDFLADIVLERSSIDVLASVDPGDAEMEPTQWCALMLIVACFPPVAFDVCYPLGSHSVVRVFICMSSFYRVCVLA